MKFIRLVLAAACAVCLVSLAEAADKKILILAGKVSHGPGDHEFRAGSLLLKKCLDGVPGLRVEVHPNGWPTDPSAFNDVDAVLIYADGGGGHPAIQADRLKFIDSLVKKGVGIGCAHYGVEVPKGDPGEAMHRWIGGHYEHQYSVNPMWKPEFNTFPKHAVTSGVKPFALVDEWYFNMRWKPDMSGITPILVAKPSEKVRKGPYVYPAGPYEHVVAAAGREETMMWTYERPDGGRGFGFTGGHKHVNWHNENCRKVVLNALLWIARMEVPENGVSSSIKPAEMPQNLDPKNTSAGAVNLTGTWQFEVETPNGKGTPEFKIVHAGQNLIGHYKGLLGEAEVTGGVSKEKDFRMHFTVSREGEDIPVTYTGTLENGGAMRGKVTFGELGEGTWTAKRQ